MKLTKLFYIFGNFSSRIHVIKAGKMKWREQKRQMIKSIMAVASGSCQLSCLCGSARLETLALFGSNRYWYVNVTKSSIYIGI